jgi:peptidoglycan hydrolase-like protein with peptidoglycan-binding domain
MRIIRSFITPAAALAAVSGVALLPALMPATPASAQPSCDSTSRVLGLRGNDLVRVPTIGTGTGNWVCELGPGNAGPAVARLQIALNDCNRHAKLTVDGIYGPDTEAAVVAVQQHEPVTVDGIYGQMTAAYMTWPVVGSNGGSCDRIS